MTGFRNRGIQSVATELEDALALFPLLKRFRRVLGF